jgi:hypothetical protein
MTWLATSFNPGNLPLMKSATHLVTASLVQTVNCFAKNWRELFSLTLRPGKNWRRFYTPA